MFLQKVKQPRAALVATLVLLLFGIQQSCKKADSLLPKNAGNQPGEAGRQPASVTEQFFTLPAHAGSALQRVAAELQRQNNVKEFVTAFAAKEGFPVWDKAIISAGRPKAGTASASAGNGGDTAVIIPLVVADSVYVQGFIVAAVADTVAVDFYRNSDYRALPYATGPSVTQTGITTAEDFAVRMMQLDREVFGYTEFEIKDKLLFNAKSNISDTGKIIKRTVKLGSGNGNFGAGGTATGSLMTLCITVTTTSVNHHCNTPWAANCTPNCDNCGYPTCYTTITSSSYPACITWEEGGGNWPTFPGGGGSGGGGNPGGGGSPACGGPQPFVAGSAGNMGENCPAIPNPWPPVNQPNNPPPNTDSIVKAILRKDNLAFKNFRDSVWNLAYNNDWEYSFLIKDENGVITTPGLYTDKNPDGVGHDPQVTREDKNGDYHTHQDHPTPDNRHPHDPQDVCESNGRFKKLYYRSYVDCGDTLYAVVTENVALVKHLFRTQNLLAKQYLSPWKDIGGAGSNRRAIGLQLLIDLLGSSCVSGLGLYKSVNPDKTEFVKIN